MASMSLINNNDNHMILSGRHAYIDSPTMISVPTW